MANGPTGPGVRTLTTAGLVAVVGAIVLGILGMHGLSQHGAMPGHGAHQAVAGPVTTDLHASHSDSTHMTAMVTGDLVTASTADGFAVAATDSGGSVSDMAMLCAVMVLAAAAGVLVALRLRRLAHGAVLGLKPRGQAVQALVSARVDTGPPAVWAFSVVRC